MCYSVEAVTIYRCSVVRAVRVGKSNLPEEVIFGEK